MVPNIVWPPFDVAELGQRALLSDGHRRQALRRAGLRYRTMYQTPHTFATLMLAAGEDIGWVAKQFGHTSVEMVIRRTTASSQT